MLSKQKSCYFIINFDYIKSISFKINFIIINLNTHKISHVILSSHHQFNIKLILTYIIKIVKHQIYKIEKMKRQKYN